MSELEESENEMAEKVWDSLEMSESWELWVWDWKWVEHSLVRNRVRMQLLWFIDTILYPSPPLSSPLQYSYSTLIDKDTAASEFVYMVTKVHQGLIEREGMQRIQRRNKKCYYF